jgi:cell division initiation protein
MLIEAQLDLLKNDDWDHLLEYEVEPIFGEAEETKS